MPLTRSWDIPISRRRLIILLLSCFSRRLENQDLGYGISDPHLDHNLSPCRTHRSPIEDPEAQQNYSKATEHPKIEWIH
jgi:hypothetical protein